MKSYRQGDVFLKEISKIPKTSKKIESKEVILAHGESTGHKHAIYDGNSFLAFDKKSKKMFLVVIKESELKHEEHDTIKLPMGKYKVILQREYTPAGIRRVLD